MLRQAIPQTKPIEVVGPPAGHRSDRAMDIFQYSIALLALAVAVLLAVIH